MKPRPETKSDTPGSVQRLVRRRWMSYRKTKRDRDGLWLVRLRGGAIRLGTFYCGSFVMAGFPYNQTPGMIGDITHLQLVQSPNDQAEL